MVQVSESNFFINLSTHFFTSFDSLILVKNKIVKVHKRFNFVFSLNVSFPLTNDISFLYSISVIFSLIEPVK